MATDRPGDYVGNHGGAYTDIDGMSKQFTMIDHDKKLAKSNYVPDGTAVSALKESRRLLVATILSYPPSLCPSVFFDFTLRGEEGIRWNETMVSDPGMGMDRLSALKTLIENLAELQGINLNE